MSYFRKDSTKFESFHYITKKIVYFIVTLKTLFLLVFYFEKIKHKF